MTAIGNSVFYCFHKNNNVNDAIQLLQQHTYKNDIATTPVHNEYHIRETHDKNIHVQKVVPIVEIVNHRDFFVPTQKDSLFWCLFVAMYSQGEYEAIHRNYGLKKMELNQTILDYLQDKTYFLKQVNHKFTKVAMTELLTDLSINQQSTSLVNIYAYLSFYKMNVYVINKEKQSYLPFIFDTELPTYFIYIDGFKQYKLQLEQVSSCDVENLKNNYICLEGIRKSLKGLSAYKIADLTIIMEKLKLSSSGMKKNDMYETILETIHW